MFGGDTVSVYTPLHISTVNQCEPGGKDYSSAVLTHQTSFVDTDNTVFESEPSILYSEVILALKRVNTNKAFFKLQEIIFHFGNDCRKEIDLVLINDGKCFLNGWGLQHRRRIR